MVTMFHVPGLPDLEIDVSDVALPTYITKRDRTVVAFDATRIRRALGRCFQAIDLKPSTDLDTLVMHVLNTLSARPGDLSVERVQDVVEIILQAAGEYEAAKAYILYRAEHARMRAERPIDPEVKAAFNESAKFFPTPLQAFQLMDKYARFNPDKGRRETWPEAVQRAVDFLDELVRTNVGEAAAMTMWSDGTFPRIQSAITKLRAMPSMRLLAMAGPAARRNNIAIYNCAFVNMDCIDAFVELLLASMGGCGVGYSVERRHVAKLPKVEVKDEPQRYRHVIDDSTEGWGEAIRVGLRTWFEGDDIDFDFSQIRPAGAPLKVKGGRASGPAPLKNALAFARERIQARAGGYLRPLDAHDIACMIGNAAVSGGVRRTALISLFDIDDEEMLRCKVGDFETHNSQRWNANNSAVIPVEGINQTQFLKLWTAMLESERGEPGIVSRQAMKNTIPSRRKWDDDFGFNPCAEVVLRPMELCNLSICVARSDDTCDSLLDKVEIATIIGTIQSLATHFPGFRPQWQQNGQEERLLGVDITGQRDCTLLEDAKVLRLLRRHVVKTNAEWATRFGINQSAATTVVKPSGNSAVLLDCSSGLHGRWAPYYERNVRVAATSPIFKVLRDAGVPLQPENGQESWPQPNTYVASFVVKAPEDTPTRNDLSALDQANYWLHVKKNWTEHNPSCTCTYKPEEVIPLMTWVWDHLDMLGGMSFLPHSDIKLAKLPYVEITKEEYERRNAEFPEIDWSKIWRYEQFDMTTTAQELACVAGGCDEV